jgi:hypothetical protein
MTRYAILCPHGVILFVDEFADDGRAAAEWHACKTWYRNLAGLPTGPLVTLNHDPLTAAAVPGDVVEVDSDGIASKVEQ